MLEGDINLDMPDDPLPMSTSQINKIIEPIRYRPSFP